MGLAVWRDISLMWLLFLTFLSILPIGIVLFFLIKGMIRLRELLVLYLPLVQEKARLVADTTDDVGHKVSQPIIGAKAKAAQVEGISKAIFRRKAA